MAHLNCAPRMVEVVLVMLWITATRSQYHPFLRTSALQAKAQSGFFSYMTFINDAYLLRNDMMISIACDFSPIPLTRCRWILCRGIYCSDATTFSNETHCIVQDKEIRSIRTAALHCESYNTHSGKRIVATTPQQMAVVPEIRNVEMEVEGKSVTHDRYLKIQVGHSLEITCSILYEMELRTTYNWYSAIGQKFAGRVLQFNVTGMIHHGEYCCKTRDWFGSHQNCIELVMYKSYPPRLNVGMLTTVVPRYLKTAHDGYLLRSDQKINIACYSDSSPQVTCHWALCDIQNKNCIEPLHCSNATHCLIKQRVLPSPNNGIGHLLCFAQNGIGGKGASRASPVKIYFVAKIRSVTISTKLRSVSDIQTIKRYAGEMLTLLCSVQYERPLHTKYEWTYNGILVSDEHLLHLQYILLTHSGRYCCKTSDDFGTFNNCIDLKVMATTTTEPALRMMNRTIPGMKSKASTTLPVHNVYSGESLIGKKLSLIAIILSAIFATALGVPLIIFSVKRIRRKRQLAKAVRSQRSLVASNIRRSSSRGEL